MIDDKDIDSPSEESICLNCGNPRSKDDKYCPSCGQKNIDGRITFRHFISDFFDAVFSLDSRVFRTIPALFVPGKLTRIYFSGKHVAYIKPLRLFFATMILFYAVLGFKHLNKLEDRIAEKNPTTMYDHANFVDSAIANIGFDTLTEDQQILLDTIIAAVHAPFDEVIRTGDEESELEMEFFFSEDSTDITLRDIYTLSTDSILKKYQIEDFSERFTVRQTIALTKHPGKVLKFVIGNTSWMILIMLPAVAAFMQLLYVRRKTYFIEHLVFLYHYHAAMFLVLTVFLLALAFLSSTLIWMIQGGLAIFFLAAMKLYYRQNWLKTIVKFLMLGFAYMLLLAVFGTLTGVISFFIYQ